MAIRYDPLQTLSQMQRDINQLFERGAPGTPGTPEHASDWAPAVDIREEDARFVIHADVPGVKPDEIEVTMDQGALTIKGTRAAESQEAAQGYTRLERVRGTFLRRFMLPDTADEDQVTAQTRDGVLEVVIPKRAKAQPRKITVQG